LLRHSGEHSADLALDSNKEGSDAGCMIRGRQICDRLRQADTCSEIAGALPAGSPKTATGFVFVGRRGNLAASRAWNPHDLAGQGL